MMQRPPREAKLLEDSLNGNVSIKLSEVLGHTDLLVERGAIRETGGGVVRFEAV